MTQKLIRNARVLTLDPQGTERERADILIDGTQISRIGSDIPVPDDAEVIDADGMLAMPGLINAHFHSTSAFMKGALEGLHLEPYMLYEAPLKPRWEIKRLYYLRSILTAMDMLKVGITSVRDDAHFFSFPTPDLIDGVFEAFRDAGMRASVALGISNVPEIEKLPFLDELLTAEAERLLPDDAPRTSAELLDLYQATADRWHRSGNDTLRLHGSVSAPQRVTPEYLQALTDFCVSNDMSLDMHVLETRTQRVHGDVAHGKSFVQYVRDIDALVDNTVLIHCVWIDKADMESIACAGAVIAHNPISNLRIGSGVMPFKAISDHGIPICLGTDEPSIDEPSNLWSNAKTGVLLQKIADPDYDNWPVAGQYLQAMTAGGARAMRQQDQIGSLEPGKAADLILVDLQSLTFTPLNDLTRHLIFAENGSSIRMTMVAGEVVCKDGQFTSIDERAIKEEINAFWPEYRADCDAANADAAPLIDVYKSVCLRAAETDVGFSRWLDDRSYG